MDKPIRKFSLIRTLREKPSAQGSFLMLPTNLYLLVFMILPLILVVVLSFLARGNYGEIVYKLKFVQLHTPVRYTLCERYWVIPSR